MYLLEFWADIPGFYGYQASYSGKIRVGRKIIYKNSFGVGWSRERLLEPYPQHDYLAITLTHNKKSICRGIHIFIALAFIPNPDRLPEVNHLNAIKSDNRACNLEWTTRKGNMEHAAKMGLLGRKKKLCA